MALQDKMEIKRGVENRKEEICGKERGNSCRPFEDSNSSSRNRRGQAKLSPSDQPLLVSDESSCSIKPKCSHRFFKNPRLLRIDRKYCLEFCQIPLFHGVLPNSCSHILLCPLLNSLAFYVIS